MANDLTQAIKVGKPNVTLHLTSGLLDNGSIDQPTLQKLMEQGKFILAGKARGATRLQIKGNMGGKYPVHVIMNADRATGEYYYDRMGRNAKIDLVVSSYDPETGEFAMDEYVRGRNNYSGSWKGKLTDKKFEGQLYAILNGKYWDFDMEPEPMTED